MDSYSVQELQVQGYDAPVPNRFWSKGSDTLFVELPGLGYTNDMPIMFYLMHMAMGRDYDVLQVNYDYRSIPPETPAEEWIDRMDGDVRPVIEAALAKGNYKNVVLAGKSIGTNVISSLLHRGFDKATAYIWITPLFVSEPVRQAAMTHGPSAALFGDADYAIAGVNLKEIADAGVHLIIQPEGDHSMMVPGNLPESIADLARAIHELDQWLDRKIVFGAE